MGIAIAVFVIVTGGAAYGIYRFKLLFRRWAFGNERQKIALAWRDVEQLMARGDEMSARLAVMHADAVLDKALQAKHFPGDRFATRMQFAQKKYRELRRVWWAHKLRNELSHNPHSSLRGGEARKAVATFKKALVDIGAL